MSRITHRGFTLIEVLVALLVVAIAYTGVATAISNFADQRLLLMERHISHRIAWNRLMGQYLVSRGVTVDQSDFSQSRGVVNVRGNDWYWQMNEDDAAGKGLVRYQVEVFSRPPASANEPATENENSTGTMVAFFTEPRGALTQ